MYNNQHPPRLSILLALLLSCSTLLNSGCQWMNSLFTRGTMDPYTGTAAPASMPQTTPLNQLLMSINNNTNKVRSVFSTNANLKADGVPVNLRANLAIERPRNFRLRADHSISGAEMDVGSNQQEFWLWIKRNQPPATFVGRHDQFAVSQAKQIFPVEPEWLIEALGLVTFSPDQPIQGPIPRGTHEVEIRTTRMTAGQPLNQVYRIDTTRGVITEQHLYAANGERIASAFCSEHRMQIDQGVVMPRKVVLEWPATKMKLTLDLWDLQVNTIGPEQNALWQKPSYDGYPEIDLAQSGLQFGPAPTGGNMLMTPPPGAPTAVPATNLPGQVPLTAQPNSMGQPNPNYAPTGTLPPGYPVPNTIQPGQPLMNPVPGQPFAPPTTSAPRAMPAVIQATYEQPAINSGAYVPNATNNISPTPARY
jgi:hypothetical protein